MNITWIWAMEAMGIAHTYKCIKAMECVKRFFVFHKKFKRHRPITPPLAILYWLKIVPMANAFRNLVDPTHFGSLKQIIANDENKMRLSLDI